MPIAVVIADLCAGGTDRQQAPQGLHGREGLLQVTQQVDALLHAHVPTIVAGVTQRLLG
jgi:hypothetical protein